MRIVVLCSFDLGRINEVPVIPVFLDSSDKCIFIDHRNVETELMFSLSRSKVYHTNYCLQTLYEHFKSYINYKYTDNQLANHDNMLNSSDSIISYPIVNSFAMPKLIGCASLSLNSEYNLLFSSYTDNNWKHICIPLLNSVKSTLQIVSFYCILGIIIPSIRIPSLLLILSHSQIELMTKWLLASAYLVKLNCYS